RRDRLDARHASSVAQLPRSRLRGVRYVGWSMPDGGPGTRDLEHEIARLSALEIVDAVGRGNGLSTRVLRRLASAFARGPSQRLGRALATFDNDARAFGIPVAARGTLAELGASLDVEGATPKSGGVLVVANHPGAYDALALMAALERDDLL